MTALVSLPFHIRPATAADAHALAEVHVASWQTTYAGIVPAEHLASLSVKKRAERWQASLANQEMAVLLAEDALGRPVGLASYGLARDEIAGYSGELYGIYLLAEVQRQGLGTRLMAAAARQLAGLGHETMLLWVLRDNPACQFYKALGGVYLAEAPITIGGADLTKAAYGWDRSAFALLQRK